MLPGGDTFVRYLGLFLYFTEWYFEPVGRISRHLKLFRKIPSRNVLICRSSVSSLGMSHRPRLCTLSKHTTPQKIAFRNFFICRGSSVVCRVTGLHFHSILERSKHTQKYRQIWPKNFFLHRPSGNHIYDQRDSKQFTSFSHRALYAYHWQSLTLSSGRKTY